MPNYRSTKQPPYSACATLLCCTALVLRGLAAAQQVQPISAELQERLQSLAVAAQSLTHSLPSISCVESGSSEVLKKGKLKRHVDFVADLRVIRVQDAGLHESFTLTQIDGKPYSKPNYPFPFYAGEGFDRAMIYFRSLQQACYLYTLSAGRIDFEGAPGAGAHPPCRDDGVHGFALLDADGNVTRVERTVSEQATRDLKLAPFAAIDLAPVELNGRTYWLARHVVSEIHKGDVTGRFEAAFSACHLFKATSTVLPGATPVTDDAPAPPHPGGAR